MNDSAASLLSIDFEAALDKLAWSQLQGTWQLPAELARLAIASGARSVALEIAPRRLALRARGARLERATVSDFASLLDRGLSAAERHRALVALERRDATVLAAIAGSPVKAISLATGGEEGLRLEHRAGGELSVVHPGEDALARPDLQLTIAGLALEAERASRWLRRMGRFAALPIAVKGHRIDRGFDRPLITGRLEAAARRAPPGTPAGSTTPRVATTLAVPRHGNAPRLWLLRHGIVATRATVPGHPSFEAAVEMAPVGSPGRDRPAAPPALLRERLGPYIDAIIDAAVGLTIRLAASPEAMPEETRARTGRLLLEAARKRRRLAEVSGVRIFPMVGASMLSTAGRRLASLDEISRCVRVETGGVCALDAIPTGERPEGFALSERGALVISQAERALLGEHLQVVFSTPPARLRRRFGRRLLEAARDGASALRFARGRPLADAELSTAERAFSARLLEVGGGAAAEVDFRTGGGRAQLAGDGTLHLPRSNADVRACVRAVARDPAWVYPALVCLAEGREPPGSEARRRWLRGG